jgi:hypothetical protein
MEIRFSVKIFWLKTYFQQLFPGESWGTYFIPCISTWSLFSKQLNLNKIWFPKVPLEITDKNKVPSENILVGTLFLTVISRGT